MSAHTPGPWFAADLRTNGADPSKDGCDIGAGNGSNIAIVLHQSGDREARETIANALLIANAPDMLEAVGEALDRIPCDCSERRRERGDHMSHCWLFDLEAAYGRATGRAQ